MSAPNPVGNRHDRRSWDQMVRESRTVTATVDIGPDESFTVGIPDTDTLTEVFAKRAEGDIYGSLAVLVGDDNVQRLRDAAKVIAGEDGRVPVTAWRDLVNQLMTDLGLGGSGER